MDDYRTEARRRYQASQQSQQTQQSQQNSQNQQSQQSQQNQQAPRSTAPRAAQAKSQNHAQQGGAADTASSVLDQFQVWWASLPAEQQHHIMGVAALVLVVLVMGSRAVPLLAALALGFYLHTRLPREASFDAYFRDWFTQEYFPKVSQKLQKELQERSKKQNVFDSMASQFKGWVMGKTESLQAAAWYELAMKFYLPAQFGDLFFMRTAIVNVGSKGKPCFLTFWGIHDGWMASPFMQLDVENTSVLDEVERQRAPAS